jgi:hypothetical protein
MFCKTVHWECPPSVRGQGNILSATTTEGLHRSCTMGASGMVESNTPALDALLKEYEEERQKRKATA